MSVHPQATREMLKTITLPVEARLLAARSFDNAEAAVEIVKLLPELRRPLVSDELALLGSGLNQPAVLQAFNDLLGNPARREATLRPMILLDPKVASIPALAHAVEIAAVKLLEEPRTHEREYLVIQLARRFRLTALADEVRNWLKAAERTQDELAEGLGTLREIGNGRLEDFSALLDHPDESVRREAITGFASVDDVAVVDELNRRWAGLSGAHRTLAVSGMTSGKRKAEAFAKALAAGGFPGFDGTAVEKLISVLGTDHPSVTAMLEANKGLLRPVIRLDGSGTGRIVMHATLKGPFTVESWIKLDEGIGNGDSLLGHKGGTDFNFYQGRLRVFGGLDAGDLLIANRAIKPGIWTHCAITRDAENRLSIYLDGEPDPAKGKTYDRPFEDLNLGESNRGMESEASYDETRIWNIARTADEIRRDFHTSYAGVQKPAGLAIRISGEEPGGVPEGGAKISPTRDFPKLVTTAEAAALAAKFDKFRKMTTLPGDAARGHELVKASCMICHQIHGEGRGIGPNLSGAGAMGTEALLRNILTPNAQLESGYYRYDVKSRDGSMTSGFLVGESADSITLRQIGADERVIPRSEVISHDVSRQSLMPEGLLDGFSEQQVADLFRYLNSLN